jgi:hypothetical protein
MNYELLLAFSKYAERRCRNQGWHDMMNKLHEMIFRYEYAFIDIHEYRLAKEYMLNPSFRNCASRYCMNIVGVSPDWMPSYRWDSERGYLLQGVLVKTPFRNTNYAKRLAA